MAVTQLRITKNRNILTNRRPWVGKVMLEIIMWICKFNLPAITCKDFRALAFRPQSTLPPQIWFARHRKLQKAIQKWPLRTSPTWGKTWVTPKFHQEIIKLMWRIQPTPNSKSLIALTFSTTKNIKEKRTSRQLKGPRSWTKANRTKRLHHSPRASRCSSIARIKGSLDLCLLHQKLEILTIVTFSNWFNSTNKCLQKVTWLILNSHKSKFSRSIVFHHLNPTNRTEVFQVTLKFSHQLRNLWTTLLSPKWKPNSKRLKMSIRKIETKWGKIPSIRPLRPSTTWRFKIKRTWTNSVTGRLQL